MWNTKNICEICKIHKIREISKIRKICWIHQICKIREIRKICKIRQKREIHITHILRKISSYNGATFLHRATIDWSLVFYLIIIFFLFFFFSFSLYSFFSFTHIHSTFSGGHGPLVPPGYRHCSICRGWVGGLTPSGAPKLTLTTPQF